MPMFDDPLHDEFASWILGFVPYGGGTVGEVEHLATQVKAGDDDSFFDAFSALARSLIAEGDAASGDGRLRTARALYLRAAALLGTAYHPLYGTPVDHRLTDAFHLQEATFATYLAHLDVPGERLAIPYEATTLPGWFVRNPRRPHDTLPTIVVGGGWDSTMVENHIAMGIAALERDYHVLLFDGPGQGAPLVDEGLILRHDWEHVVTPVIDLALTVEGVDVDRLVYQPWSLGGYFAPRVAAFEHRLAAVIADPGQLSVGGKVVDGFKLMGLTAEQAERLPALDPDFAAGALQVIESNRPLDWALCKRAFWTNGAADLPALVAELWRWTITPELAAQITTPILVCSAEGDRASTDTDQLWDLLTGPKTRMHFTAAEGTGQHCEMLNRPLANDRILDWLDRTLAPPAG